VRPAAATFALSRGLVWLAGAAAVLVARPSGAGNRYHFPVQADVGRLLDVWSNWDGAWYAGIAEHGYRRAAAPAFFPLYPYLTRGVGFVVGGHVVLAAVLVSLAAGLASFYLLHRLRSYGALIVVVIAAVMYLAFFPTALFLQAAYAESLFLVLALATFLLAERGHLLAAGTVCGLALLTRPAAIAVVLALVVFVVHRRAWTRGLASVGVSFAIFAVYPVLLVLQGRAPLAFLSAQSHWGRHFSVLGPLKAVLESISMTAGYALRFFTHPSISAREEREFQHAAFNNLLALLALVAFVALLVAVYRRFGARSPYFVYAAVSLLVPLCSPIDGNPLLSLPRFGLVIFPFFIALAMREPKRHRLYVAASATLLVIASASFALYGWVA